MQREQHLSGQRRRELGQPAQLLVGGDLGDQRQQRFGDAEFQQLFRRERREERSWRTRWLPPTRPN